MRPGTRAFITFHSKNPEKIMDFCSRLGFKVIQHLDQSVYLTDGMMMFEILPGESNFTSLTYLTPECEVKREMAINLQLNIINSAKGKFRFFDPNGVLCAVREEDKKIINEIPGIPISQCGTFYEMSIETNDIDTSVRWYENIGFKLTAQQNSYSTIDDGNIVISLYQKGSCPHKFKNPSLTYFEPDMKERIAEIKKRGVVFIQEEKEIGMNGHAIAESPDGQYFFLFKA